MSNVNRLLKGLQNNATRNSQLPRILNLLEERFGYFTGESPIPNQALDSQLNKENEASCLFFSESAYHNIKYLYDLMQDQAKLRKNNKWKDRPIQFVCYGYKDENNDYYIEDVQIPIYDLLKKGETNHSKTRYEMMSSNNQSLLSASNRLANREFVEYLQNPQKLDIMYTSRFALMGFTHSPLNQSETSNCMLLGELAKSTLPGDKVFKQPVMTGTMILTPAGMECAVIEYDKNSTGKVTPKNMINLTRAELASEGGGRRVISAISRSVQPLDGLPAPKYLY